MTEVERKGVSDFLDGFICCCAADPMTADRDLPLINQTMTYLNRKGLYDFLDYFIFCHAVDPTGGDRDLLLVKRDHIVEHFSKEVFTEHVNAYRKVGLAAYPESPDKCLRQTEFSGLVKMAFEFALKGFSEKGVVA